MSQVTYNNWIRRSQRLPALNNIRHMRAVSPPNATDSTESINSLFTDNPNILYATDNLLMVASRDNNWSLYARSQQTVTRTIRTRDEGVPLKARNGGVPQEVPVKAHDGGPFEYRHEGVPFEARDERKGVLSEMRRIFRACFRGNCGTDKEEIYMYKVAQN